MILTADSRRRARRTGAGPAMAGTPRFLAGTATRCRQERRRRSPARCIRWRSWWRRTLARWCVRIFTQADQFQVVVQGGGRLGRRDTGTVAVHYTDAWSAYGPIVAAAEGVSWFTLRNTWDPGAKYMPAARSELRAARAHRQHREAPARRWRRGPGRNLHGWRRWSSSTEMETPDGMASWRFRLPGAGAATGPDPGNGGGQFWLVLAGHASCAGSAPLPGESCVFVGPEDGALAISAGPDGAELLCVQFPAL